MPPESRRCSHRRGPPVSYRQSDDEDDNDVHDADDKDYDPHNDDDDDDCDPHDADDDVDFHDELADLRAKQERRRASQARYRARHPN